MNADVALLASPRVTRWPSTGVRWMTASFAEAGLSVVQVGGSGLRARGVLVSPHPGGMVVAEDAQRRILRIKARSVIRVIPPARWGVPFEGCWSEAMIPYETAMTLLGRGIRLGIQSVVILGTGNEALRLGHRLLTERQVEEVFCLERSPENWGGKRYAGWEVERRRFEKAGGRCLEGEPLSLRAKGAQRWELRLQDRLGIRPLEIGRMITVGPFDSEPSWSEYPPGSLLFGLRQTAHDAEVDHVEGHAIELRAAQELVHRIRRALGTSSSSGGAKKAFQDVALASHRDAPFMPEYRGKLFDASELERLRAFPGVPRNVQRATPVASLECIESIACDLCQRACPAAAIDITRKGDSTESFLIEDKCIGCGLCVQACPSQAAVMVREKHGAHHAALYLSGSEPTPGEMVTLVNRRGESLGTARVARGVDPAVGSTFEVEVPNHLIWDARGIRRLKKEVATDEWSPTWVQEASGVASETVARVECLIEGQKRICREGLNVAETFFELGLAHAQDALLCPDGSCGLCTVAIDGVKRLGCQTPVRAGMTIQRDAAQEALPADCVCPCLGLCEEDIVTRIQSGHLSSIEAVVQQTGVGSGTCHGARCMDHVRQLVEAHGIDAKSFLDWSFPFSDWTMVP